MWDTNVYALPLSMRRWQADIMFQSFLANRAGIRARCSDIASPVTTSWYDEVNSAAGVSDNEQLGGQKGNIADVKFSGSTSGLYTSTEDLAQPWNEAKRASTSCTATYL